MKFLIVDPHLYEKVKDDPGLILAWDPEQVAGYAHRDGWRAARRRTRFTVDLSRAFELMKKDLFAL